MLTRAWENCATPAVEFTVVGPCNVPPAGAEAKPSETGPTKPVEMFPKASRATTVMGGKSVPVTAPVNGYASNWRARGGPATMSNAFDVVPTRFGEETTSVYLPVWFNVRLEN